MREIPLTQGAIALVDDEDFDRVAQYEWYYHRGYAASQRGGRGRYIEMQRFILELRTGDKRLVDHRNRNKLDNRRDNLRIATKAQNRINTGTTAGITRHQCGKWQAQISISGKRTYLGLFQTPEEAKQAYNKAAKAAYGEFAA